jgi:hypothetical protein
MSRQFEKKQVNLIELNRKYKHSSMFKGSSDIICEAI